MHRGNPPQTWWRHQMEMFSALLAICAGNSPVSDEFPAQRPVTQSFDVFFDLRLNKCLSKQSWDWWFETLSSPLWRRCNETTWQLLDNSWNSGPLFTKRADVLPQDFVKSRSHELGCYNVHIVQKFDSAAAEVPQTSERFETFKHESGGFEIARDHAVRRPSV